MELVLECKIFDNGEKLDVIITVGGTEAIPLLLHLLKSKVTIIAHRK